MKGNLKNLNELVGGTIIRASNGYIGVVRLVMGNAVTSGIGWDICQARLCITFEIYETYATYRRDGISHQSHSYDIEEVIRVGDGVEIKSQSDAKAILREFMLNEAKS